MSISSEQASSRTAAMVAAYRARASERADAICRDPWARALAGEEGFALAKEFDAGFPHMELWMATRTGYVESLLRTLVAAPYSFRQVVLLGAGFDTRAARFAQPGVRFFEVDYPASQEEKRRRLAALSGYPVDAASYVSCDFEAGDFVDELVAAGFELGDPAFVVWEGVVHYLTEPSVRSTLRRISSACHPRSIVIFDHFSKHMAAGTNLLERDHRARAVVATAGEPFRWGTNDALPMLYEEGFRYIRSISFDEACVSLTGTYERERRFRFTHMALASVSQAHVL